MTIYDVYLSVLQYVDISRCGRRYRATCGLMRATPLMRPWPGEEEPIQPLPPKARSTMTITINMEKIPMHGNRRYVVLDV